LASGDEGIEFATDVAPLGSHPNVAFWHAGDPGVATTRQNGDDFAIIPAVIKRCVYNSP
jgi:hypothetical protein